MITLKRYFVFTVCDENWQFFDKTRRCYKDFRQSLLWEDANHFCADQGFKGSLASIKSQETQDFIKTLFLVKKETSKFWIGGHKVNEDWLWTDGTSMIYENWNTNEPNNINGIEHYTRLRAEDGRWEDWNNITSYFICQYQLY